jgi:hypothetical protein
MVGDTVARPLALKVQKQNPQDDSATILSVGKVFHNA